MAEDSLSSEPKSEVVAAKYFPLRAQTQMCFVNSACKGTVFFKVTPKMLRSSFGCSVLVTYGQKKKWIRMISLSFRTKTLNQRLLEDVHS